MIQHLEEWWGLYLIGGIFALLVGALCAVIVRSAQIESARRQEIYASCSESADYPSCRQRWLDSRGLADPDAPKPSSTVVIPTPIYTGS